jgi:hypothetical protein
LSRTTTRTPPITSHTGSISSSSSWRGHGSSGGSDSPPPTSFSSRIITTIVIEIEVTVAGEVIVKRRRLANYYYYYYYYYYYFQSDTKKLGWFVSISGDDIAGRWLRARLKCDAFKFTNDHFSAAVAYRLHHRQPYFIQGSKCNCKTTPLLDELGHHTISTACGQGGHRIMTHDSVKFCIKDLLNSCGIKTRVEVAECLRVANPENNQRPDLMLYNAPDFNM